MNEHEVIASIPGLLPQAPPEVLVPVGDDCAVVRLGGQTWVAASDMLVFGHHFKGWADPEDVGYKAVAANVSDVAAMGGVPRFVLVSGGADDGDTVLRCLGGVAEACRRFGVYPLGGDTTRAEALTIDVAILGELPGPAVLRSGARPGDALAVTGELGASAAGLLALEDGRREPGRLVQRHLRPEPRVQAGLAASRLGASAMMDLSDGLAADARRLCASSGVGCRVDLDLLPVADDTRALARAFGRDPETLAATGGEDYELLVSGPGPVLDEVSAASPTPLTLIGRVTERDVIFVHGGEPVDDLSGWDHFA